MRYLPNVELLGGGLVWAIEDFQCAQTVSTLSGTEILTGLCVVILYSVGGSNRIYNFDQNADGLHGYNIIKNDNGKIVFIKHIEFTE